MKYRCDVCGYIYDEDLGEPDWDIEPGTKFENLPEDFVCPVCIVEKEHFKPVEED